MANNESERKGGSLMKRMPRRKHVALVLSSTETNRASKSYTDAHGGDEAAGIGGTLTNRCYICHKQEGEKRVALQSGPGAPGMVVTTVRLSHYRVDLLDRFSLDYVLCFECAALLHAFEVSGPAQHADLSISSSN